MSISTLAKFGSLASSYGYKAIRSCGGYRPQCSLFHYQATKQEFRTFAETAIAGLNPYRADQLPTFLKVASLAAQTFPLQLRELLYDFKQQGNEKGFVLIRSLPEDPDLMDTPEHLQSVPVVKKTFFSEFWLSAVGGLVGELFGYIQENNGNLFHNVRPAPSKATVLSSESSKLFLDLHSETAFHPFYPDFLSLHCLRSDRTGKAATVVSSLRRIRQHITPQLDRILREPLYQTGIDYSFGNVKEIKGNGPIIPILRGDPEDPLIIFDPDLMVGITEEARRAIATLKQLFDQEKELVFLERGDLLLIDNYRALHGRTPFTAYYDGKDRWLQRTYITRNLLRASQLFDDKRRVVHYTFSDYLSPPKNKSHDNSYKQ